MPRKKKTKSRNRTAARANGELANANRLFALADELHPQLLKRRDEVMGELERLDRVLAKLGGVVGPSRSAPAATPAAAAPARGPKKRGPRGPRSGGPSLRQIIVDSLGKGGLSSAQLFEAVAAKRPGTGRGHLQTELFQLGRKGIVKVAGKRGSYTYSLKG